MENSGGVFEFSVFSDCGGFAVALSRGARDSKGRDGALGQQLTKFFADFHQFAQVFNVFAGARIFDDCDRCSTARRRLNVVAHLSARFFQKSSELADFGFHRSPSSPLISEASSPPTRA